jgi:RNase adaptor protein for sRNA GlmZ degradation
MNATTQSPILTVEITSFSFKQPLPSHLFSLDAGRHGGGFVFDCRSLPNPGRQERFKAQTGLETGVREFLEALPEVREFRASVISLVEPAVRNFLGRQFTFMNVSFGCTGGQHRSVFFAEELARHLGTTFQGAVTPTVVHYSLKAKGFI